MHRDVHHFLQQSGIQGGSEGRKRVPLPHWRCLCRQERSAFRLLWGVLSALSPFPSLEFSRSLQQIPELQQLTGDLAAGVRAHTSLSATSNTSRNEDVY